MPFGRRLTGRGERATILTAGGKGMLPGSALGHTRRQTKAVAIGFRRCRSMEPTGLPHFAVAAVRGDCCTGRFGASSWVGEGWIAGLYLGGGRFLWGRFRDVDATAHTCSFYPDEAAELSALRPGESYPFMAGYWGDGSELVWGESRHRT